MGLAVIPDDWTDEYIELCIKWPNSEDWLAILRGQLTGPAQPEFWDKFTGDPDSPQIAIYPTFDQNLHAEVCMKFETGMIMMWPKSDPPTGWIRFDGALVLKSEYLDLWEFLGNLYGEDGDYFQVGPVAGAFPCGLSESSNFAFSVTNVGGEETHMLDTSEIPSHNHTQNSHGHTQNTHNHTQDSHNHTQNAHSHVISGSHYTTQASAVFTTGVGTQPINAVSAPAATATNQTTAATNQGTVATNQGTVATNQTTGGSLPHNNLPPFFVTNFIIKM